MKGFGGQAYGIRFIIAETGINVGAVDEQYTPLDHDGMIWWRQPGHVEQRGVGGWRYRYRYLSSPCL